MSLKIKNLVSHFNIQSGHINDNKTKIFYPMKLYLALFFTQSTSQVWTIVLIPKFSVVYLLPLPRLTTYSSISTNTKHHVFNLIELHDTITIKWVHCSNHEEEWEYDGKNRTDESLSKKFAQNVCQNVFKNFGLGISFYQSGPKKLESKS